MRWVPESLGVVLRDALNNLVMKIGQSGNAETLGVAPILFRIDIADASADTDVVMAATVRVIDAWGHNTGIAAHAANDTWQLKNGATAMAAAVAKTATVNAVLHVATLVPAQQRIAAGGTLRITAVKDTNAAVTVYVLAVPVA